MHLLLLILLLFPLATRGDVRCSSCPDIILTTCEEESNETIKAGMVQVKFSGMFSEKDENESHLFASLIKLLASLYLAASQDTPKNLKTYASTNTISEFIALCKKFFNKLFGKKEEKKEEDNSNNQEQSVNDPKTPTEEKRAQ